MREKILPVIVTTYEALCTCLEENVRVIYAFKEFYTANTEQISQALMEYGYEMSDIPTNRGVFFVKGLNIKDSEISDPCDLF